MASASRILIVEDNDFVRMQIMRFLVDAGYACFEASGAEQGLEQMSPDVAAVIVDVRMAPIDGFAFIAAMREHGYAPPVIIVTGDQNPDILVRASALGVVNVLAKPVQKDRLLAMLARAVAATPHV